VPDVCLAARPSTYRPRHVVLRDGRGVTLRPIVEADAAAIVRAFEHLSDQSRYFRFMQHKKQLDGGALQRGVHPRPGHDFVFVATPAGARTVNIVGAAQYVLAAAGDRKTCEFAITVAEEWRGSGLAGTLLSSLVRRARYDGYQAMEGFVLAENVAMLALARRLKFKAEPIRGDATMLRVCRAL